MVSHHRIADVAPVISQSIHERVTRHHAHIGAAVPAHALQQLEEQLASEAGRHYVLGEFEKALDTYCHTLAVVEKARRPGSLSAMRHNIAACLHQLGDVEAAREYYELALNGFESRAAATPKIEAILFGNADARRADFVRGRLVDINWERKPDTATYLDADARTRKTNVGAARRQQMMEAAQELFFQSKFAEALSGFEAALDDLEGEATHSRDASAPDWRGSCLSNMAACEHHLGHWEAAAGLYGRALAELWEAKRRRKPIERVEEVAKGVATTKGIANKAAAVTEKGATERRIDFISGRLRLVERRERPPMGKILDKDAREACFENRAPPQEQPPAVAPPRAAGPPIATRPAEEAPPPVAAEASADGGYEPYEGPIV